jgi:hypothetical protein
MKWAALKEEKPPSCEEYFSWTMVCMTNIQTDYGPSGIVI